MTTQPVVDFDLLRVAVSGDVIAPDDAGWDAARAAWDLLADQHPALIVLADDAADVAETVRFARSAGLRVAAQGTGHGANVAGALAGTILIRTGRLNRVGVDPERRTARAGAGALWSDVVAATAPHGLAALHGFAPSVGVAGYVLGGGLGWLARRYGLASSHVRSFEVVTADGAQRRVDALREPELFWALRGGGGAGAIVTSVELELLELEAVYAGAMLWPIERAGELAHAYREWMGTAPGTVTSSLRLLHFPPSPELPVQLRGRALAQLALAFLGSREDGDALIAPLRALGPEIDRVRVIAAPALVDIAGDPVAPMPVRNRSRLLATLTPETVDAVVALAGPATTVVEIRHLGGALRHPADAGAAGAVNAEAIVFASGVPTTPEHALELDEVFEAVARLTPGTDRDTLPTFAAPGDVVLSAANRRRLGAIAAAYDPHGLIAHDSWSGEA